MFNIPPFLTLRQPDLPSTATPPPARASTMESLGFVLVFFGKDWCGYVNVPKKDCLISVAHHSFSLGSLIFPPLQHRPLQERAMWRFLDLLVAFFWENMMWVCQCSKKKCQISKAHHSFSLGSLIFHPLQHRPLQGTALWRFLDLFLAFFLENMMWVCQCSKKKCQISIAHHSFPLGSLILHPTLQRHKAEFRAPTPLDAHSTWDFNTYVCI